MDDVAYVPGDMVVVDPVLAESVYLYDISASDAKFFDRSTHAVRVGSGTSAIVVTVVQNRHRCTWFYVLADGTMGWIDADDVRRVDEEA